MAAKADTQEQARALIEPMEADIRRILTPAVWGADDDTFQSVVGRQLAERGLTLAAMESCTGGLFSDTITNVPGASRYFRGAIVSYATEVKELMGVDPALIKQHTVISAEVAMWAQGDFDVALTDDDIGHRRPGDLQQTVKCSTDAHADRPPVEVGVVTPKPRATPRARPSFHPRNAEHPSAQPKQP